MIKLGIHRIGQNWWWGFLQGLSHLLDGLVLILTLGHYSMNLTLICAVKGAKVIHDKHRRKQEKETPTSCQAGTDGECNHPNCPQVIDGEPEKTGRHCPLPHWSDDPEY